MERAVSEILMHCESSGAAPSYRVNLETYHEQKSSLFRESLPVRTEPVQYTTHGEEIFVVSDLHIAAGKDNAGVYEGTENFFADDSFARFLDYARNATKQAILVINGDIFDFVRITDHPGKVRKIRPARRFKNALRLKKMNRPAKPSGASVEDEFKEWSGELAKIGIKKSTDELKNSISSKEREYGLKTDDYKTVYRLIKIRKGHPQFFAALSTWLVQGHSIIVLKGNHDLELYWPAVRNYLRLILAEGIVTLDGTKTISNTLTDIVLPNLTFIDDAVEIDKEFYAEHGHRYDTFTMVLDNPVLQKDRTQINLPFGSFFNRYLINRIELFYPFLDNVRPSGNILPMLMRENFALGLKILFQHVWALFRVLTKNMRYVWFMFHKVLWFILALVVPLSLGIAFSVIDLRHLFSVDDGSGVSKMIGEQIKGLGALLLSYALSRFVAWFQLTEPSSLDGFARIRFEGTSYRIMTMGHTHNPGEYLFDGDRRFYNTGTWIPVIETSSADVREDKTYTFLHLRRDQHGKLQPGHDGLLQRWNDDAGRAEPQILVRRK